MIVDFKYSVGETVFWNNNRCVVWGIYIHKDGTYEYHIKITSDMKRGIFKVKETELNGIRRN